MHERRWATPLAPAPFVTCVADCRERDRRRAQFNRLLCDFGSIASG